MRRIYFFYRILFKDVCITETASKKTTHRRALNIEQELLLGISWNAMDHFAKLKVDTLSA